MIDDESNVLQSSKKTFSDILEGVVLKNFSEGRFPDRRFLPTLL